MMFSDALSKINIMLQNMMYNKLKFTMHDFHKRVSRAVMHFYSYKIESINKSKYGPNFQPDYL